MIPDFGEGVADWPQTLRLDPMGANLLASRSFEMGISRQRRHALRQLKEFLGDKARQGKRRANRRVRSLIRNKRPIARPLLTLPLTLRWSGDDASAMLQSAFSRASRALCDENEVNRMLTAEDSERGGVARSLSVRSDDERRRAAHRKTF